ncbi:MAG TPA: AI-2E family transporter, partial [Synergistaceae bacterium]|nr:AI-2E family transporter [Synergistaceae bacterium]
MSMVEDNEAGSYERRKKGFLPFGLVFALLAFLAYSVTQPLLRPIAWSVLLTFFVRPFYVFLYERFFRGRWKGVAAAITTILVLVVIVVPVVIIG